MAGVAPPAALILLPTQVSCCLDSMAPSCKLHLFPWGHSCSRACKVSPFSAQESSYLDQAECFDSGWQFVGEEAVFSRAWAEKSLYLVHPWVGQDTKLPCEQERES